MADFSDGLLAYYEFENNLEATVGDFDGEEMGDAAIPYGEGQFGQAIVLDWLDKQYVELAGETDELAFLDTEMTGSTWFRVDSFDTDWQGLVAKGEGDAWRVHRRGSEAGVAFVAGEPETPSGG